MIVSVLAATIGMVPTFAATGLFAAKAPSCPAGKPVTAFKLFVQPPQGGEALPVRAVNVIEAGDELIYEPVPLDPKGEGGARIAILLAAASGRDAGHIAVLDVKPAKLPAAWKVPVQASIVGVVFGPNGLNEGKINKLVKKNPELVMHLSDYVEQTSRAEALVQVLSKYQQAAPGTSNLQASLTEFSSQYGVAMPAVSSSETPYEQTEQLLHAVNPAFSNDPLGQSSMSAQSAGVAASVATFFMGPQFGILAGGTVLLSELHTLMFPRAEFRAAFAQLLPSSGMDLCTGKPPAAAPKQRTRVAYLWATPVPNAAAPSVSVDGKARIPTGWKSSVEVKCASASQLRLVGRARDWHLASEATDVAIPVSVSIGPRTDFLALDLTHAKLPVGEYHLTAKWDWTPLSVAGNVQVVNFAEYSSVKISRASRDHLVSGAGTVKLAVAGADFEFLRGVSLLHARGAQSLVARLPFSFPSDAQRGGPKSVTADVDTSQLAAGAYLLQLTQLNGKTHDIPVTVHPANPTLAHLPVRVNLGEAKQTIELHGTALGDIEKITSAGATWTLGPMDDRASAPDERDATIHLSAKEKKGALLDAKVFVAGIEEPLEFSGVLRVAGPRPKIINARKSFAAEGGVALRDKEIPGNSQVSFSIHGANFDYRARLHLKCQSPDDTRRALDLTPGERSGGDELDSAGEGMLFLSLNAGEVGQSGCALMATLTDDATGTSDPYFLGQIVQLPRIDKFTLTDEKLGDALYAGILTGQDLQEITKTGWDGKTGAGVENIPTPVPGQPGEQTLKIAMPWPPPSPGAALYVWLNGETQARATTVTYQ